MNHETKKFCKMLSDDTISPETCYEVAFDFTILAKGKILPLDKLMNDKKVKKKVDSYRKDRASMSKVSRVWVKAETVALIHQSKAEGNLSVTRGALDLLAKLNGYYEETAERPRISLSMKF